MSQLESTLRLETNNNSYVREYDSQSMPVIQIQPDVEISFYHDPKLEPIWNVCKDEELVSLDSLPNGNILAICGTENVVKMYNLLGEEKDLPFPLKINYPHAVAVHKGTGTVAIAGTRAVTLFSLCEGQYKSKAIQTRTAPWAVGFTQAEIVIGAGNEPVLIKYRSNGQKVWEKKVDIVEKCPYLAVDDRFILTDTNKVHVHSQCGTRMFTIPSTLDQDAFLQTPCGVCTDSKNNILVADRDQRVVLLFNPVGMFDKVLVHVSGKPTDISLHKDRYLLVGTSENGLYLFDIDGYI